MRIVVAVILAALGTAVWGLAGNDRVLACSCQLGNVARDVARAPVIVHGKVIDFRDDSPSEIEIVRRWLVEVDDRYRGATADVLQVELHADGGDCDDWRVRLPNFLLLYPIAGSESYSVPACSAEPTERDMRELFDEVPPVDLAAGDPAVIQIADAGDHNLEVVDESGNRLAYLPGDGTTIGLTNCPGDRFFAQVVRSTDGDALLVRRRFDQLEPVEVVNVGAVSQHESVVFVSCRNGDATDIGIGIDGGVEYINGVVGSSVDMLGEAGIIVGHGNALLVDGAFGLALLAPWGELAMNGVEDWRELELPIELERRRTDSRDWDGLRSIRRVAAGWEVTMYGNELSSVLVAPDGETSLLAEVNLTKRDLPALLIPEAALGELAADASVAPRPLFQRDATRLDMAPAKFPAAPATAADASAADVERAASEQTGTARQNTSADAANADDSSGGRTWMIALFFGIALGIFIKVAQKRASRKQ